MFSSQTKEILEKFQEKGVSLDETTMRQLGNMMVRSIEQLEAANRQAIVDALRFDSMDARYKTVTVATEHTFEWIFTGQEAHPHSETKCDISFKTWLADEGGIFHICGKPGSGKSAFMKFLYTHPKTTSLLQQWAGDKRLVIAQCFFWKPGSDLQKNLEGMSRSLLSQILERAPEVTSHLFPQYWEPDNYHFLNVPTKVSFERCELQTALRLFDKKGIFDTHRICLFIDALDEFEDEHETQISFARLLQKWVQACNGGLKICVSSRDLPVFQQHNLGASRKIMLQDLNYNDIKNFVDRKLELEREYNEEYFQSLDIGAHANACEKLSQRIFQAAEGVFLWVVLIMQLLCDEINNRESYEGLNLLIDSCPLDLQTFFTRILNSIPGEARKEAYIMLAFALSCKRRPLALVIYVLLREFIANPKDPQYPETADSTIQARFQNAPTWLSARCKGLLELGPPRHDNTPSPPLGLGVVFVHRSIPEFLEDMVMRDEHNYLRHLDYEFAIIVTLTASVKLRAFPTLSSFIDEIWFYLFDVEFVMYEKFESKQGSDLVLRSLDALDDAIEKKIEAFQKMEVGFKDVCDNYERIRPSTCVMYVFATFLFYDYVEWFLKTKGKGTSVSGLYAKIFVDSMSYVGTVSPDEAGIRRYFKMLLDHGVHQDLVSYKVCDQGLSLWEVMMVRKCSRRSDGFWYAVRFLTELGATPPFWFRLVSQDIKDQPRLELRIGAQSRILIEDTAGGEWPFIWGKEFVPECLRQEGGTANLLNFLDAQKMAPKNATEVRKVLERAYRRLEQGSTTEVMQGDAPGEPDTVPIVSIPAAQGMLKVREDFVDAISELQEQESEAIRQEEEDEKRARNREKLSFGFLISRNIQRVVANPLFPWLLLGTYPSPPFL